MKILILASNPRKDLNLEGEIRHLQGVIERSKNREHLEVEVGFAVQPEDLQGLLLKHEPEIIHFCGHGTGEQGLVLQDDIGLEKLVSTDALSNLFELCSEWVKCVLLNACYSEVQANSIIQHVNYAIGMNHEIRDDAAIAFATGFYQALGYGQPIEKAFKFGCNAIQLQISDNSNFRSALSEEKRKLVVATTIEKVVIPEHLKPKLKIKPNLASIKDKSTSDVSKNLLPSAKLDIQSSIDKALEKENVVKQDREQFPEYSTYNTIRLNSSRSLPQKTRMLFVGGIMATLALVLTSSFLYSPLLSKSPQPEQKSSFEITAKNFLRKGLDKNNQGDYKRAISDFTQAIKIEPNYADAYNYRGRAHFELGNNQTAISDFTQAIKIEPNYADTYNYRGLANFRLGNNQGAIANYTHALKIDPNYAYAYNNRGLARSTLGDNQGAIEDYTKAIEINPNYAKAYNNRGLARSKLGDNQSAIADYTHALKIDPNYAYAYNNRGLARSKLGDNQSAIADYTHALKIDPNYAYAYNNRSFAHFKLGDNQSAIEDYKKAAELFQQQGNEVDPKDALDRIK